MPMNIQYGNMNPLSQLQSGIATGMQLGGMMNRQKGKQEEQPQPLIPPLKKEVTPNEVLTDETKDMIIYDEWNKKTKNLSPEGRKEIMGSLVTDKKIKTELGVSIVLNDEVIKPDELVSIMKGIKSNDETSRANTNLLIEKLGGKNSVGGVAVKKILKKAETLQDQYDQQYFEQSKMFIADIDRRLEGKGGKISPSYLQELFNTKYAVIGEIAKIDPNWSKQYLTDEISKRRSGGKGFKPENFKGKMPDGTIVYGSGVTIEEFQRKHPGVRSIEPVQKRTEFEAYREDKAFKENPPKGKRLWEK